MRRRIERRRDRQRREPRRQPAVVEHDEGAVDDAIDREQRLVEHRERRSLAADLHQIRIAAGEREATVRRDERAIAQSDVRIELRAAQHEAVRLRLDATDQEAA